MKKLFIFGFIAFVTIMYLGVLAHAEKRMDVIVMSNGYPSGAHFNLNIHGKKNPETFMCEATLGGNSVFISEYGTSHLEYVWNKKATSVTGLTVLDACGDAFDGDAARVQIPYDPEGYYVFARLRGKPNNSQLNKGDPSNIILKPNPVLKVCKDEGDSNFSNYTEYGECDGSLMALGLVTNEGVYEVIQEGFFRVDPQSGEKGKGKAKAKDITGLFYWTGYVFDASLDINGDGVIDESDMPEDYEGGLDQWMDENGELLSNVPIWDIADLVIQEQEITNDGGKLLKIRWYPVSTTTYN